MYKTVINISTIIFLFTAFACKQKLSPKELVSWVEDEDNELRISKDIGEIRYMMQYRPLEYVFAKEKRQETIDNLELDERMRKLQGSQYFLLRMSKVQGSEDIFLHDISGEGDYYQRVNYCNSAMAEDIHLIQGKDTLNCTLFQYVPTYGIAPYADFVMAFDDKKNEGDKIFVLNDRLFGAGEVKFTILESAIKNIPEIITE